MSWTEKSLKRFRSALKRRYRYEGWVEECGGTHFVVTSDIVRRKRLSHILLDTFLYDKVDHVDLRIVSHRGSLVFDGTCKEGNTLVGTFHGEVATDHKKNRGVISIQDERVSAG